MADEEEDDLAALRNAVLASMKTKPKLPKEDRADDDIDIEALRLAALRTKKQEPANCQDNSLLPVEPISSTGRGSPYRDHSPYRDQPQPVSPHRQNFHQPVSPHRQNFHQPGSPHRQNFHQPGSPHRQNFIPGRGHLHRPNFQPGRHGVFEPRGGGMQGAPLGRGFGPRAQFNPNPPLPPSSSSNLIVLTEAPSQPPKGHCISSGITATQAVAAANAANLLARPQDKWAGSGSSPSEPVVKVKPKGPARFSRLEDSDSDSDESDDDDNGTSSAKDSVTSSSSSSEDEPVKDDSDKSPDEVADKILSTETVAAQATEVSPCKLVADDSVPVMSEPPQSATKPDYTRVPPPALSPAPSPPRKLNPLPIVQQDRDGRANVEEQSNGEQELKRDSNTTKTPKSSQSIKTSSSSNSSNKQRGLGDNSDMRPLNSSDACLGQNDKRGELSTKSDDAILAARRRKFATVSETQSKDIPKTISLSKVGPREKRRQPHEVKRQVQSKVLTKTVKLAEPNGRSRSSSASSGSVSSSDQSNSSSSSSASPSDSDSDSDSMRRDKYKTIERGKEDIERERRQRVAREREERHNARQTKDRNFVSDREKDRVRRPGMDRNKLPRAYSENMNRESVGSNRTTNYSRERQYLSHDRKSHQGEQQWHPPSSLPGQGKQVQPKRDLPKHEDRKHEQFLGENQKQDRLNKDRGDQKMGEQKYRQTAKKGDNIRRPVTEDGPKREYFKKDDMPYRIKQENPKSETFTTRDNVRKRSPKVDRLKQEQTISRLSGERNREHSIYANSRGNRSITPDTKADLRHTLLNKKKSTKQRVKSGSDLSDFSTGSDFDSPPQKLRSVTQVVKPLTNETDRASTSRRSKEHRSHSRTKSVEKQQCSQDRVGSQIKIDENSTKIIVEADHSRCKKKDARQIICKLKGVPDEDPASEKSNTAKLSPKINITFNDDPDLEEKPTTSRLSVHDRLGMPVKRDKHTAEFNIEPKITRRVITEDPADARHRLKERRRDNNSKDMKIDQQPEKSLRVISEECSDARHRLREPPKYTDVKDAEMERHRKRSRRVIAEDMPIDARDRLKERRKDSDLKDNDLNQPKKSRRVITEEPVDVKNRLKVTQNNDDTETNPHSEKFKDSSDKHKRSDNDNKRKKNYSIWSTKREVSVDSDGDEVSEPPPSWINPRLGMQSHRRSLSPDSRIPPSLEPEVGDARSRLTSRRDKKRSMEQRLGSVGAMPAQEEPEPEDIPVRKRGTKAKKSTGTDKEAELNARIQRIREKNANIELRRQEVERDKQRYAS